MQGGVERGVKGVRVHCEKSRRMSRRRVALRSGVDPGLSLSWTMPMLTREFRKGV